MKKRVTVRTLAATTALLALGGAAACSSGGPAGDPQRVDVVAAFYPSSSSPNGSAGTPSG